MSIPFPNHIPRLGIIPFCRAPRSIFKLKLRSLQSIPKLHFPGGALIGCSAGFLNVLKIKGTHNAMKSGMIAAETAFRAVGGSSDMSTYEEDMKKSWIWDELREVRNLRPSFNTPLGIWGGIAYSGLDSLILKGRVPWTFRTKTSDAAHTKRARYVNRSATPSQS